MYSRGSALDDRAPFHVWLYNGAVYADLAVGPSSVTALGPRRTLLINQPIDGVNWHDYQFQLDPGGIEWWVDGVSIGSATADMLIQHVTDIDRRINMFITSASANVELDYLTVTQVPEPDSDGDGIPDRSDNCPAIANPDQADADEDGAGDACDSCPLDPLDDADGDGVCGDQDTCANSDLTATIVIDGCDTGVTNALLPDGCTMADKIAELASSARNHGEFVSGVAHLTNGWNEEGLITGQEKGRIQKCAAQAAIPRSK